MTDTLMTAATTDTGVTQDANAAPAADVSTQQPPAADTGADAGNTDGATNDAAKDDAPTGAPEVYEDFTMPEGVELDAKASDILKSVAKGLDLPQDKANKLASEIVPAMRAAQAEQMAQARAEWESAARSDKEFGGEKLAENVAVAAKALQQFGTPELAKLLNESGLGNHPEIIRAFYRAGKAISEDSVVTGGSGAKPAAVGMTSEAQKAAALYPNQK